LKINAAVRKTAKKSRTKNKLIQKVLAGGWQ